MQRLLCLVTLAACGGVPIGKTSSPTQPGVHTTFDVVPKGAPGYVTGYDFELLDAVQGTACYSRTDPNSFSAVVPGVDLTVATDYIATNALNAAAIDAISKLQGADTILITRMRTTKENDDKTCATIDGRGIRLLKPAGGPTMPPPSPPAPEPPPDAKAPAAPPAK